MTMTAKEYLANWKPRIHKAGLTQEQVSLLTGIPAPTLSSYISGRITPRFDRYWEVETLLIDRGV